MLAFTRTSFMNKVIRCVLKCTVSKNYKCSQRLQRALEYYFLLIITTKPISINTHFQTAKNRNYTFIVKMRYNFELAVSVNPLRKII